MLAVKYTTLYQILCETEVHFSLVLLKIKLIIEIIYFKRIYLSAKLHVFGHIIFNWMKIDYYFKCILNAISWT